MARSIASAGMSGLNDFSTGRSLRTSTTSSGVSQPCDPPPGRKVSAKQFAVSQRMSENNSMVGNSTRVSSEYSLRALISYQNVLESFSDYFTTTNVYFISSI